MWLHIISLALNNRNFLSNDVDFIIDGHTIIVITKWLKIRQITLSYYKLFWFNTAY